MKILKSRSGIAIENAIAFMLIIFLLCALLSSLMLFGMYQNKLDKVKLTMRTELDQIGEDFLSSLSSVTAVEFKPTNDSYKSATLPDNDVKILKVYKADDENNETVLLYVEVQIDGSNYTLKRWCYCNPDTESATESANNNH